MARLIDVDKLGIGRCNPDVFENKSYADGWNAAVTMIENAPAVDAEPVRRGKRLIIKTTEKNRYGCYGYRVKCSECGCEASFSNYCPNCGAKMEDKSQNE